jgi:hypothetical protein
MWAIFLFFLSGLIELVYQTFCVEQLALVVKV